MWYAAGALTLAAAKVVPITDPFAPPLSDFAAICMYMCMFISRGMEVCMFISRGMEERESCTISKCAL